MSYKPERDNSIGLPCLTELSKRTYTSSNCSSNPVNSMYLKSFRSLFEFKSLTMHTQVF